MLQPDDLVRYRSEGFLVCDRLLERAACDALTVHLSSEIARVGADYLAGRRHELGFWDLMRRSRGGFEVFWDPARGSPGESFEGATGRVGHALHAVDAAFGDFCAAPPLRTRLRQIVGEPGVVLQSALIYKQPQSDVVQFGMHQDASYLTTAPESLALAFIALDDMSRENGCLEVIPRSHLGGLGVTLRLGPDGFAPVVGRQPPAPSRARAVSLEIEKGTVVFVDGRTYHASGPNGSNGPRRALILHAMSARSRLAPTTWILEDGQPPRLEPL